MTKDWLYLIIAGLMEIIWAIGMKYSQGFSRLWPTAITILAMAGTYIFLNLAIRTLPIGTAYAVWTGIGTAGTAIAGMLFFQEPRDILRILSLFLILAGIAGLKLTSR
jgi:quaternary ammonium compound-resistance protein SugE